MKKIKLSTILKIQTIGAIQLKSWKRRQYNRIQDQTQNWLFEKEYFFSSYTQEKRTDEKELKRRDNQDLVRSEYQDSIKNYLRLYRLLATCIKQFFPNYSSVEHDNFKLDKPDARLLKYRLVHKDVESDSHPDHDYSVNIKPDEYWKSIIYHGVTAKNFDDLVENELVREISPEIQFYYSLRDSLTGWYIKKIIRCREWMTDTSQVFYSSYKFADIDKKELCNRIIVDFKQRLSEHKFAIMFKVFGITQELIDSAIKATLNDAGRKKKYTEWFNANKHKWQASFSFQQPKNYHLDILGLEANPTKEEIKKAFRKKSLECHPDIIGGDGKAFVELMKSYTFLMS